MAGNGLHAKKKLEVSVGQSFIGNLVSSFRRFRRGDSPNGIPSPEEFSRILKRERERSDRSGVGFSLVVFETGNPQKDNDLAPLLIASLLSRRHRAIDEVGWLKDGTVAAVLPGTSPEGAWKFAKDVLTRTPRETLPSGCKVYTYPTPWMSGGNGGGKGPSRDITGKDESPADSNANPHPTETQHSRSMAEGLEPLLCRPIPIGKRILDVIGALAGLILLSPLFLLIAAFIKIVSPGPAFYRQERIGYLGTSFTFWKFRTMHVASDSKKHRQYLSELIHGDAPMLKLDDGRDNRIIPFGKFLRYSCLDELPQLINVLLGDMSLVGPRPCLPYEANEYLQWHARRFDTVPGMTGLWQVSGKNRVTFKEMIRLDIRYSQGMSFCLDIKILLLTGPAILGMMSEPLARKLGVGQESMVFNATGRG